jgi:hypothetical protein
MKNDQGSFFQLDPIHGRGALLAHAENLDLIDEVAWSLSPDGRNVAYLVEHIVFELWSSRARFWERAFPWPNSMFLKNPPDAVQFPIFAQYATRSFR